MSRARRVYGLGLGRTGTKSLVEALEKLGYGPARHNPGTFDELREVRAAAEGAVLNHWKFLAARYEDAVFVLTKRDSMERWLDSCRRAMSHWDLARLEGSPWYDHAVRNRMYRYGSLDFQPDLMRAHCLEHEAAVERFFQGSDRLLTLVIDEDPLWERLCSFLDVPVPEEAFPHQSFELAQS